MIGSVRLRVLLFAVFFPFAVVSTLAGCRSSSPPQAVVAAPPAASDRAQKAPARLELVAHLTVEPGEFRGLPGKGLGGISGITYDAKSARWLAISDERRNPMVLRLTLDFDPIQSRLTLGHVEPVTLQRDDAAGLIPATLDLEGIARMPDGSWALASEGDGRPSPPVPPGILLYEPDGRFIAAFSPPDVFMPAAVTRGRRGVRPLEGFESLTISPSGTRLFTAAEFPLFQDDEIADLSRGAVTRLLEWRIEGTTLVPGRQFAYPIERATPPSWMNPRHGDNGLSELLALDENELLALERGDVQGTTESGAPARANPIRIFQVTLADADDVSDRMALRDGRPLPVLTKRLVLDFETLVDRLPPHLRDLENFEAMGLGPPIDGTPSLLVVSDENFNPHQRLVFLLFRLIRPA